MNRTISPTEIITLFKFIFYGFLLYELWEFSKNLAKLLEIYMQDNYLEARALWISGVILVILFTFCRYRGVGMKKGSSQLYHIQNNHS